MTQTCVMASRFSGPGLLSVSLLALCLIVPPSPALAAETLAIDSKTGLPFTSEKNNTDVTQSASGKLSGNITTETTEPPLCGAAFGPPALAGFPKAANADATTITADETVASQGESFSMKGDVRVQRGELRLRADQATFTQSSETVSATGGVDYEFSGFRLSSDSAEFRVSDNTGKISASEYWLPQRHLRGKASSIEIKGKQVMQLNDAFITSCEKGQSGWKLTASELRLDRGNNEGVAKHARLEFMQVPFFYFPWLSFPIEGRKTGLLVPNFGSSDSSGKELGVPWYWNIAPHRDATFTPTWFSDRGVQLQTEFRYLNQTNAGQVDLIYLQDDEKYRDDRYFSKLKHEGHPAPSWHTSLVASHASDSDYLNDFDTDLANSSLTHLEQRLSLGYQGSGWRFDSMFEAWQTMDDTVAATSKPYRRLPHFALISERLPLYGKLSTDMTTSFTRFEREASVTGRRVHIQPAINWDHQQSAGFARARLGVRYTSYRLENNDPATNKEPSFSLPVFSLDSGLFFERDMTWGEKSLLQTLEPRLFYLYVPYRDQSQLIMDEFGNATTFDSGQPQLSLAGLFRENRFSGLDRAGDANQLTFALASRIYSTRGRELFSASLGQIHYFSDRQVTLPDQTPGQPEQAFNRSDIIAELRSHWSTRIDSTATWQWDSENGRNDRAAFKFRYQQDQDRIAHLAWRYERDSIDQADISLLWPLHRQWKAAGRWYYSLHDDTALERVIGLEYQSCCWALRLVSRDQVDETLGAGGEQKRNKSIWLQLELKGLASVGKKTKMTKKLFTNGRLED